jgi:hypothetical protein
MLLRHTTTERIPKPKICAWSSQMSHLQGLLQPLPSMHPPWWPPWPIGSGHHPYRVELGGHHVHLLYCPIMPSLSPPSMLLPPMLLVCSMLMPHVTHLLAPRTWHLVQAGTEHEQGGVHLEKTTPVGTWRMSSSCVPPRRTWTEAWLPRGAKLMMSDSLIPPLEIHVVTWESQLLWRRRQMRVA